MELREKRGVFYLTCAYEEHDIPKRAGFRWHSGFGCLAGDCPPCQVGIAKAWWTIEPKTASRLSKYADVTVLDRIQQVIDAQTQTAAASRATTSTITVPAPPGLSYRPFQLAGIAFAASRPATLLADEPGLGKTVQALGLINYDASIRHVLIVCPASLKLNWQYEAERWLVRRPPNVVIVNYDRLHKMLDELRGCPWDLLVADESHYCKSPDALRSKALYSLRARKVLFLTGTPILNKPIELFPQIHYLDPTHWPDAYHFAERYCAATKTRWGLDASGAANLDELNERLTSTLLCRRLKTDVLAELPPKIRQIIPLAPNGSEGLIARQWEAWRRYESEVQALKALKNGDGTASYQAQVAALREGARTAFADVTRLRQEIGLAKLPAVIEAVRAGMEAGKIVVFAHHQSVQDALMAEFGAEAVLHRGGLSDQKKQQAVDRFQNDPAVRIFVGSIRASGTGLTLTASSHVIFAEQDWTPAVMSQCEDRCHRIGQQDTLFVQHLVFDGSLDATMVQRQAEKQGVIDLALDGQRGR